MLYRKFIILILFVVQIHSAKILAIFPFPSLNHQIVFRTITNELVKRGHEVVIITTDPEYPKGEAPANITEIDVHDISYETWQHSLMREVKNGKSDRFSKLTGIMRAFIKLFETQIMTDDVKSFIEKRHGEFDLILMESSIRASLAFSHIYKVPVIGMSSSGFTFFDDNIMGALTHPLLFPYAWHQRIYNLTPWEKIQELWTHFNVKLYYDSLEKTENEMLKKAFGDDIPPLQDLYKNIQLIILNTHPLWVDNQPVAPNVVYMGELKSKPAKQLSKNLEAYLNSSKADVIFMSFESKVVSSSLPQASVREIINALSQVPFKVLLKWDSGKLPLAARNIKVEKSFSQSDVLRNPKVKLFITQGGRQSIDDAITAGVPIIGLPILSDQMYNIEKCVHRRIGVKLNIQTITAEELKEAINTILTDESYRENIVKLRALMLEQPQPPLERAVWWIEHVLRHGGGHLRPPTADLSFWDYLEMDLVLLILGLITSAASVLAVAVHLVWKYIGGRSNKIKVKQS